MRYNILGFDQEKVLELRTYTDGKEKKLDVTDLLILNHIYHFPERKGIKTITQNGLEYYWIEYNTILKELPILNIKKPALRERIDKMCALGLIEKTLAKQGQYSNMTCFRIGEQFEKVLFQTDTPTKSKQQRGVNSNTQGVSIQTEDMNNNVNNKKENNNTYIKDTVIEDESYFEQCWEAYNKKGNKTKAKRLWSNIAIEQRKHIIDHIKAYVGERELLFQK
ncbi:MAG: hypothetical protein J6P97_06675, partial [Bacteroidales bacterium]|nr:hypothetical protein [Bacteroidales bacterium]